MVTIKEAIIEFADCCTTLFHFGPSAGQSPLPLGDPEGYRMRYQKIAAAAHDANPDPRAFPGGSTIERFKPSFRGNRYWHWQLARRNREVYAAAAWWGIIPLEARLQRRIARFQAEGFGAEVLPELRTLIYPFGWSTWVSLLVRGRFSLEDLSAFADSCRKNPGFLLEAREPDRQGEPPAASDEGQKREEVEDIFATTGEGICKEIFGGKAEEVESPPQLLSVVTVLDKLGSSLSLQGLSGQQQTDLWRLLGTTAAGRNITKIAHKPHASQTNFDFVLQDNLSAFIWLENLLTPGPRHQDHLRCYHNNTFRALLQALHLCAFLKEALKLQDQNARPPALADLFLKASYQLTNQTIGSSSPYRNAAVVAFLKDGPLKQARADAEVASAPGGSWR